MPEQQRRTGPKKEKAGKKTESYVITWLSRTKLPFEVIDQYLKPAFFENELYRRVAADILKGKEEHEPVKLSRLIDSYAAEDEEAGKTLSRRFMEEIDEDEKTAAENLRQLKRDYLNRLLREESDPQKALQIGKARAALDKEMPCLHQ